MGMDQTFYVAEKSDTDIFMKKMRRYFIDTPDDIDRYDVLLESIELDEIEYARKNFFLHELIMNTVIGASKENGGWTRITLDDLIECIKIAADCLITEDYEIVNALITLTDVARELTEVNSGSKHYNVLYSADW